jgi:hypothetical protein
VSLTVPGRARLGALRLRLRLPHGKRIARVLYDMRTLSRFDPRSGTITLPTLAGEHELEVGLTGR